MSVIPFLEWLPEQTPARQLFVLLHGESAGPEDMAGVAAALRHAFPESVVLAPASGQVGQQVSGGYEWFATDLSDDGQRLALQKIVPDVHRFVAQAQQRFGVSPEQTALVGYAQGATVALESVQDGQLAVAGRVIAFSGRFVSLPSHAPTACTYHILHGQDDTTTEVSHAHAAHGRLAELAADSTLDIASQIGHELHPALVARAIVRLQTCVPLRSWKEALGLPDEHVPAGTTLH